MEDFVTLINDHRSIRKYKSQAIDADLLNDILHAGTRAATSGNMQFYSIVVTKEEKLRKQLHKAHNEQKMILEAPVIITFCADQRRLKKWFDLNSADYMCDNYICLFRSIIDTCLVAQNIVLAAEANGLGTCYMGTTLMGADKIIQILNLPGHVIPVTSIVMGYPDEDPDLIERLPMEAVIHEEKYQDYSSDRIFELYEKRERQAWERLKSNDFLNKLVSTGEVKNTAQAYSTLKYSPEKLEEYSNTLKAILKSNWNLP